MSKDEALDLALEVLQINLKLLEKINPYKGQEDLLSDSLDLTYKAITAIKQALAAPVQQRCEYCDGTGDVHDQTGEWRGTCHCVKAAQPAPVQEPVALLNGIKRYEPEIFREDRIRMELEQSGEWVKYADVELLIATPPAAQPAPVQEQSCADVQLAEQIMSDCGISSTYRQALVDRIANRIASHRPTQPAPVQPVGYWLIGTDHVEFDKHEYHDGPEWEAIYATPPAQPAVPLTDEQKRDLIKKSALWDMHIHIGWYSAPAKSFVEKTIQLIADIEAAHGITKGQP